MAGDKAGPLASSGQPSGLNAVLQGANNFIGEGIMSALQKAGVSPQDCHDFLKAGMELAANAIGSAQDVSVGAQNNIVSTGGFKTIVGGDGKFMQVSA